MKAIFSKQMWMDTMYYTLFTAEYLQVWNINM